MVGSRGRAHLLWDDLSWMRTTDGTRGFTAETAERDAESQSPLRPSQRPLRLRGEISLLNLKGEHGEHISWPHYLKYEHQAWSSGFAANISAATSATVPTRIDRNVTSQPKRS